MSTINVLKRPSLKIVESAPSTLLNGICFTSADDGHVSHRLDEHSIDLTTTRYSAAVVVDQSHPSQPTLVVDASSCRVAVIRVCVN